MKIIYTHVIGDNKMNKKISLFISLFFMLMINVNASKITENDVLKKHEQLKNPKTGINNITETIIPITLIGVCLIINTINKSKK